MKKLIVIALFLIVGNLASAQSYYYKSKYERPATFQVAPTYFNYKGGLVGYQIGINIKEVFNISYFHTRNYAFGERFMDDRFAGIHTSLVFPVSESMQVGPAVRFATYNAEFEKVFFAIEARLDLNESWKIGFEYGKGAQKGFGMKFIWNMY